MATYFITGRKTTSSFHIKVRGSSVFVALIFFVWKRRQWQYGIFWWWFDDYNHNIERLITKVENDNNDFHDCNDGDHSDCDGFGGYDYFNDHETVTIWL